VPYLMEPTGLGAVPMTHVSWWSARPALTVSAKGRVPDAIHPRSTGDQVRAEGSPPGNLPRAPPQTKLGRCAPPAQPSATMPSQR